MHVCVNPCRQIRLRKGVGIQYGAPLPNLPPPRSIHFHPIPPLIVLSSSHLLNQAYLLCWASVVLPASEDSGLPAGMPAPCTTAKYFTTMPAECVFLNRPSTGLGRNCGKLIFNCYLYLISKLSKWTHVIFIPKRTSQLKGRVF